VAGVCAGDGGGSASLNEALDQGRVISPPPAQDRFVDALREAYDGAEDHCMRVALDDLLDQAIEGRDRIGEDRGAGRERGPLRAVEAPRPVHAAVSAEAMGERLMARREQIDRERAGLTQSGERRGRARKADDKRRRGQRQGRERDDRTAGARFTFSAGDDRDARRQRPHRMSKGGAVGVPQSPVAHARRP
jgi:hypothetical protein